jgi:hypothetical protein
LGCGVPGWLEEQAADAVGDVASDGGGEVLVPGGHCCVGPSHHAHDGAFGNTEQEEHGGGGVARVVQSTFGYACAGDEQFPFAVVGAGV